MIEFNKTLERQGFEKMRDRRADAATREEDPTGGDGLGVRPLRCALAVLACAVYARCAEGHGPSLRRALGCGRSA